MSGLKIKSRHLDFLWRLKIEWGITPHFISFYLVLLLFSYASPINTSINLLIALLRKRDFIRFILVCMFARRAEWNGKFFRCHRMEQGRLGNWNRNLIVTKFNYFAVTNWKINFDYATSLHSKFYVFLINGVKNYWKIRFQSSRCLLEPRTTFDLRLNSISVISPI